jgi:hypothetical protein
MMGEHEETMGIYREGYGAANVSSRGFMGSSCHNDMDGFYGPYGDVT